jgi:hypothetical protein
MSLRACVAAALALCAATTGCASSPDSLQEGPGAGESSSGSSDGGAVGSVGLNLSLPAGQSIEVVSWTISGPNGAASVVQSGAAHSQGSGFSFLVGGIPAASNYRVALSGTATDGSVTCTGATPFDVASRTTTQVTLLLACSVSTAGAHVTLVNGTSFNCAAANGIASSPSETTVGHSVALTGHVAAPDPNALTYAWSAASGAFDSPTSGSTGFQCTAPGPVTVTLTVADGPVPAGQSCSASLATSTVVITCDSPQGPPDAGASPVPATPPWGVAAMVAALAALGAHATRRRQGARTWPALDDEPPGQA